VKVINTKGRRGAASSFEGCSMPLSTSSIYQAWLFSKMMTQDDFIEFFLSSGLALGWYF